MDAVPRLPQGWALRCLVDFVRQRIVQPFAEASSGAFRRVDADADAERERVVVRVEGGTLFELGRGRKLGVAHTNVTSEPILVLWSRAGRDIGVVFLRIRSVEKDEAQRLVP